MKIGCVPVVLSLLRLPIALSLLMVMHGAVAQESRKITKLKDLCIETMLVADGKPQAVIVAPAGERYGDAIRTIQGAVRKCAGVELPVRRDGVDPEALLKEQNVVALGNMATNPFVEHMYRQWYVLLDLKYPGKGGHVVRSLHNPYATGRNVIWIGGSDDAGVGRAAEVFGGLLKPGSPFKVGWLMQIQLGEGMVPPKIGDDVPDWVVYSWRDSWRKVGEKTIGYAPSTYFGWNPISIAGVLYYMTGRKEYLDYFKAMAMPNSKKIPLPNRTDAAFNDPMNPLVKNYHYRAHLVDCVYDLIEESPLFTNDERLFLTNKLVEHQDDYDPKDNYPRPNNSRHGMWHMLNIYTGSRYLSKYYPSPRWVKRMDNVRKAFHGWIGNPTWGELDTLSWVSTSTEPVFEFFMLDGFKEFVESGTAKTMMSAMEILWSGRIIEESNRCLTINLLHKAAYMMKDGRYIWLAQQLGFDYGAFRIGQSFWPPPSLKVQPPTDLIGKVSYYPLPKTYWKWTGESIPLEEGFQVLSYRSGLTDKDDFLQIDGFYGRGRNPYHVNPIYLLRMGGRLLLSGYGNQLHVRRNGMVERKVAMAAALKRAVALNGMAYIHTQVPDMPFSCWDRRVLYLGGDYTFVFDEVKAKEAGTFELTLGWDLMGGVRTKEGAPRRIETSSGIVVCSAQATRLTSRGRLARQHWTGDLKGGQTIGLSSLVCVRDPEAKQARRIDSIGKRASLVRGDKLAFVGAGHFESDVLAVDAEMACITSDRIVLVNGLALACNGRPIARCEKPVSLVWRMDTGELCLEAKEACRLALAAADGEKKPIDVQPGQYRLEKITPEAGLTDAIAASLDALSAKVGDQAAPAAETPTPKATWKPKWQAKVNGKVTHVAAALHSDPKTVWVIAEDQKPVEGSRPKRFGRLSVLSPAGQVLKTQDYDTPLLSLWTAADAVQAKAFAALVGFRDDMFRAFSAKGDLLWEEQAAIHPSFKIGDRYQAPWFSDPRPDRDHRGVFSILVGDFWGKGGQEIAIGRPCTVEFRGLDGKLIERVPTHWGDNTSLAMLRKPGKKDKEDRPRWLLVGKFITGSPGVTPITAEHKPVADGLYGGVEPGTTRMNAWSQRGLSHMVTSDIDKDGMEEVVIVLSGHWNQVNVYKGGDWRKCLWTRCFGPARSRSRFMTSLVVADITGSGTQEVVLGMGNGWVCGFDKDGKPLWQRSFPGSVLSMAAMGAPAKVLVGCADGALRVLDGQGLTRRTAVLDDGVTALSVQGDLILTGTASGTVAEFAGAGGP